MFQTVIKFIEAGGFWVLPILFIGAIGIGITIERYIKLQRAESQNRKMWDKLQPVLQAGDFDTAREMTTSDKSYVSQLLSVGFERQGVVRRREDFEIAMDEVMMSIVPQLEKRTPYTALFANLATLMGLLGTVLGVMDAFIGISTHGTGNISAVAPGVAEALVTTVFGLAVAIPAVFAYNILVSRLGLFTGELEGFAYEIIGTMAREGRV